MVDGSILIVVESMLFLVYLINGLEGFWIDINFFIDLVGGSYELYVVYESLECIVVVVENFVILIVLDVLFIINVIVIDVLSGSVEDG